MEGAGWLLAAALLAIASTWPAVTVLGSHALEPLHLPDVQGGLFWPWAFAQSIAAGEPLYLRPELQWPDGQNLRLIIWNHAVQLVIFPFFLRSDPVTATNLAALWIATLNGAAGAWAGAQVTGRRWGALLGLSVAACAPYGFVEAGVGRPEQGLWAPLALYFGGLVTLWAQPSDRRAALACGLGVGLAGAVYWFYAIFLVTLMVAVLPLALAAGPQRRQRLVGLCLAGGVAIGAALPFALPLLWSTSEATEIIGTAIASGEPVGAMQQRASMLLPWGYMGAWGVGSERAWRAPLLVLPACLAALSVGRGGVRLAGGMGALAALLSAGPLLLSASGEALLLGGYAVQLPQHALNALPGYERFWWPYRWQAIVLAASTVALPAVVQRLPAPPLWAGLIALLSVGEAAWMLRDAGVRPVMGPAVVPAVFEDIGRMPGGPRPILQLPSPWLRNSRVGWIAWHRQPIDGGMGWGLMTEHAEQRRRLLRALPLVRDLDRAVEGAPVARRTAWLPAEAGGYHYVVLYANEGPTAERQRLRRAVHAVLGAPFYDDGAVVAWVVPGVGTLPQP